MATRQIVGWSMADHLKAGLCIGALAMALQRHRPPRGLVHHSDRGVQGRFRWSSQRLEGGGCDGCAETALGSGGARRVAAAGPAGGGAARAPAAVLGGDRGGAVERGRGGGRRRVAGGWGKVVPGGGRHATSDACAMVEAALRAVPVGRGTRGDRALARAGPGRAGDRPPAGAGGVDDLAGAAAQRRHARRRSGVSRHRRAVARRAGCPPPEAGETGGRGGAAEVWAGPAGRRGRRPRRGGRHRAGRALERPEARTSAGAAMRRGVEPGADRPAPAARLPRR